MDRQMALLEAACVEFEARHTSEAEATIQQFRRAKGSVPLFQHVVEHSKLPAAQFMAASALRDAFANEWVVIPVEQREAVCQYPLHVAVRGYADHQPFVRSALLHAAATAVKRGSLDPDAQERSHKLFDGVESLVFNGDTGSRLVALLLLSELTVQHNLASCAAMGLPRSFHVDAAINFEANDLPRVFAIVLRCLSELRLADASQAWAAVAGQALEAATQVFAWDFVGAEAFLGGAAGALRMRCVGLNERIRPSPEWAAAMLADGTLDVFFEFQRLLRGTGSGLACDCLLSLASVTGVFSTKTRTEFLRGFLRRLQPVLGDDVFRGVLAGSQGALSEVLGVAAVVERLVSNHGGDAIVEIPDVLASLAEALYRRTRGVSHAFILASRAHSDAAGTLQDSHDLLVAACARLVLPLMACSGTEAWCAPIVELGGRVFMDAVQCLLDDCGDDDGPDSLENLATLSRVAPGQTLGHVCALLQERGARLMAAWQHPGAHGRLLDELEVLVTLASHCLTDGAPGEGETPQIPDVLNKVSDPVIALTSAVAHLSEAHSQQLETGRHECLSPALVRALLWFLRRWAGTYLMPDPEFYAETPISPLVLGAYGTDTAGGTQAVSVLVRMAVACVLRWTGEEEVAVEAGRLLLDLVSAPRIRKHVVGSEPFWAIVTAFADAGSSLAGLAPRPRRLLSEALARACLAGPSPSERQAIFQRVTEPVERRVSALLSVASSPQTTDDDLRGPVMGETVTVTEMLRGIARATEPSNHRLVFDLASRYFDTMVQILRFYHAESVVVKEILKFFKDLAERQSALLSKQDAAKLFAVALQLLGTYSELDGASMAAARSEAGKAEMAGSRAKQLHTIIQFLQHLITREFVDFADNVGHIAVSAADVSVDALVFLLPLMTDDVLRFPKVAAGLFRLLCVVSELCPRRVFGLPAQSLESFFRLLRAGVCYGDVAETARAAMDALYALGSAMLDGAGAGMDAAAAHLLGFQRVLLEQLLVCRCAVVCSWVQMAGLDVSLLDSLSDSLMVLSMWRPAEFVSLTSTLEHSIADPELRARLGASLHALQPHAIAGVAAQRPSRGVMRAMKKKKKGKV